MNKNLFDQIVMESKVLDDSSEWLSQRIILVAKEIDLVESLDPIDYLKLGQLKNTLIILYRRARIEDKICDQFYTKYAKYTTSGKSEIAA